MAARIRTAQGLLCTHARRIRRIRIEPVPVELSEHRFARNARTVGALSGRPRRIDRRAAPIGRAYSGRVSRSRGSRSIGGRHRAGLRH